MAPREFQRVLEGLLLLSPLPSHVPTVFPLSLIHPGLQGGQEPENFVSDGYPSLPLLARTDLQFFNTVSC